MGNFLKDVDLTALLKINHKHHAGETISASLRLADDLQNLLLIAMLVVLEFHSVQLFHQHCIFLRQHALRPIVRLLLKW